MLDAASRRQRCRELPQKYYKDIPLVSLLLDVFSWAVPHGSVLQLVDYR
ncbi:MAG: hypothetical protein HYR55_01245 [Acidobacteria bacterium]|nr:hypothetical protein [Acidobacteriota bacterium]MBI3655266.1 hypothetical protein [Acidobacteriota bacterium]